MQAAPHLPLNLAPISSAAQELASNPAHSVWVSASAGTGKTKVLTERVLRLLLEGTAPEEILCITFTKAAAAEMALRVHNELARWVIMNDDALAETLKKLTSTPPSTAHLSTARKLFAKVVDNPESLKILTIHSFCQSLLKRFPLEAGLAPHFSVAEEDRTRAMLEEARLRLITGGSSFLPQQKHERIAVALRHIAQNVGDKSFNELLQEIINQRGKLAEQIKVHGSADAFVRNVYGALGAKPEDNVNTLLLAACKDDAFDAKNLRRLAGTLRDGKNDTDRNNAPVIFSFLESTPEKRTFIFDKAYASVFITASGEEKKLKSVITEKTQPYLPDAADIVHAEQRRILKVLDDCANITTAQLTESMIHVSEGLMELYAFLKKSQCLLDFDDLIKSAANLLEKSESAPWIRFKLDGGINHVLVDEAQDTSPLQWQILKALCEEFFSGESSSATTRTLFVVGDEKQSIYSFQGADVSGFNAMHTMLKKKAKEAKQPWHSVSLDKSFRSVKAVLDVVDAVFKDDALARAVTSDAYIPHEAHRLGHAGRVELWPALTTPKQNEKEFWPLPDHYRTKEDPAVRLADTIALQIQHWLESGRILPAKGRAVAAGDIMILIQQRNEFVETLIHALKRHNVPVAGVDRLKLTEHIAIMDLMALGHFALLPDDDYTLACLLKSPLFGFSEEQLFELAYGRDKQSLWERLKQSADKSETHHHACEQLSATLAAADYMTPFAFFSKALDAEGGRSRFISRMGTEVNDTIDEFLNLSLSYASQYTASLQHFLHWLVTSDIVIKRNMEHTRSEVRVMTVHAAKGLQAPIVILPDTTRTKGTGKVKFLWNNDGLVFWPGRAENYSHYTDALKIKQKANMDEEAARLLYVALTRAEDELYICGHHLQKMQGDCWHQLLWNAVSTMEGAKETIFPLLPEENNKGFVVECPQTVKADAKQKQSVADAPVTLPHFMLKEAAKEEVRIYQSPSRMAGTEGGEHSPASGQMARARGVAIHRLLELLPTVPEAEWQKAAERIVVGIKDVQDKSSLIAETVAVMRHQDFKALFLENSRAEVSLAGQIGGKYYAGQIDRITITENEIFLIDYKTNVNPPKTIAEVSEAYLSQMAVYATLLQEIYPNKIIRAALLWTQTPHLMPLENEILLKHLP